MIYPNKHIRFEESILYKMLHILTHREVGKIGVTNVYELTKSHFDNIDEFIYALDVLYSLDMIEVDFEAEILEYVK